MAYSKFILTNSYFEENAISNTIHYIIKPEKALHGLIGGYGVNLLNEQTMINSFKNVKKIYHKEKGRQLKHFIVSFSTAENITPILAYQIAWEIATLYSDKFQVIFAVHEETQNVHIHFIINTVSFTDGHMFDNDLIQNTRIQQKTNQILQEYTAR